MEQKPEQKTGEHLKKNWGKTRSKDRNSANCKGRVDLHALRCKVKMFLQQVLVSKCKRSVSAIATQDRHDCLQYRNIRKNRQWTDQQQALQVLRSSRNCTDTRDFFEEKCSTGSMTLITGNDSYKTCGCPKY